MFDDDAGTWLVHSLLIIITYTGLHFEDGYTEDIHVKTTIDEALKKSATDPSGVADQSDQYSQLLFLKLEVLRWYLVKWRGTYDYIFWTDADSIFLNTSRSIVDFCTYCILSIVLYRCGTHVCRHDCKLNDS